MAKVFLHDKINRTYDQLEIILTKLIWSSPNARCEKIGMPLSTLEPYPFISILFIQILDVILYHYKFSSNRSNFSEFK